MAQLIIIGFDGGNWPFLERFIKEGVVDAYILLITPVVIGGLHAIEQIHKRKSHTDYAVGEFPRLIIAGSEQTGNDLVVWGTLTE